MTKQVAERSESVFAFDRPGWSCSACCSKTLFLHSRIIGRLIRTATPLDLFRLINIKTFQYILYGKQRSHFANHYSPLSKSLSCRPPSTYVIAPKSNLLITDQPMSLYALLDLFLNRPLLVAIRPTDTHDSSQPDNHRPSRRRHPGYERPDRRPESERRSIQGVTICICCWKERSTGAKDRTSRSINPSEGRAGNDA